MRASPASPACHPLYWKMSLKVEILRMTLPAEYAFRAKLAEFQDLLSEAPPPGEEQSSEEPLPLVAVRAAMSITECQHTQRLPASAPGDPPVVNQPLAV